MLIRENPEGASGLPIGFLRGRGFIAVMYAYIDESLPKPGTAAPMAVAGYLFPKKQADRLDREWRRYLAQNGLDFFRMSECANRNGQFAGWSAADCLRVEKSLIGRVKQRAAMGFVTMIDLEAHAEIFGRFQAYSAYALACFGCISLVSDWLDRFSSYPGDVSYVFEAGHERQRDANALISAMSRNSELKKTLRYGGHSFMPKHTEPLLQTGDLLAWQCCKHYVNEEAGRPARKDFYDLVRGPVERHMANDYDRQTLLDLRVSLQRDGLDLGPLPPPPLRAV